MNRRNVWLRMPSVLLISSLVLAGCMQTRPRLQSDDEADADVKYPVQTVGDVSDVGNAEPIQIGGVGLVEGLQGTGAAAPQGGYRSMLEAELRKRNVRKVNEILADPNYSIVLVSATLPPGCRKGDPIDVDVAVPAGTKTTSLRGGRLQECVLFSYDFARNLSANYANSDKALLGHPLAKAEGKLLVGFGDGDESARLRQARIWGGGRCNLDRGFHLVMRSEWQYARVTSAVAERINETFPTKVKTGPNSETAVAKNRNVVVLNVPPQYKHNLPRFLRVVRAIALRETPESLKSDRPAGGTPGQAETRAAYRRQLEEDLLIPARTIKAALRLEALGSSSTPVLKAGLHHEHALVRFASAEALAYLGSPSCGEELARLVEEHPALRAFSLTALASLDEAVCHVKLRELLGSPKPETRYGAFRALRALDANDVLVQGELLNDSFWLHRTAPQSSPLVHVSSTKRAEVVLFGEEATLKPPFYLHAGEFTLTAGREDDHCTIGHFSAHRGSSQRRQCSLKLEDVLRTMAALGGLYPEVVDLLRQANECQSLSCRVAVDQLPQAVSIHELARAGVRDEDSLLDQEIRETKPDLGVTPNLYQHDVLHRTSGDGEPRRKRTESKADERGADDLE